MCGKGEKGREIKPRIFALDAENCQKNSNERIKTLDVKIGTKKAPMR